MKKIVLFLLCSWLLFSCGYDFYLNHTPVEETVSLTQSGRSLTLTGYIAVGDGFLRTHLESDYILKDTNRGYADITYDDNGQCDINYRSIPIPDDKVAQLKNDIYAMYFAGNYPYKTSFKKFGRAEMVNNTKMVYDTDGYLIYKVNYDATGILLYNIIGDYSILVQYPAGYKLTSK